MNESVDTTQSVKESSDEKQINYKKVAFIILICLSIPVAYITFVCVNWPDSPSDGLLFITMYFGTGTVLAPLIFIVRILEALIPDEETLSD